MDGKINNQKENEQKAENNNMMKPFLAINAYAAFSCTRSRICE